MKRFYIQPRAIFEQTETDDLLVYSIHEDEGADLEDSWAKESRFDIFDEEYDGIAINDQYEYSVTETE